MSRKSPRLLLWQVRLVLGQRIHWWAREWPEWEEPSERSEEESMNGYQSILVTYPLRSGSGRNSSGRRSMDGKRSRSSLLHSTSLFTIFHSRKVISVSFATSEEEILALLRLGIVEESEEDDFIELWAGVASGRSLPTSVHICRMVLFPWA